MLRIDALDSVKILMNRSIECPSLEKTRLSVLSISAVSVALVNE